MAKAQIQIHTAEHYSLKVRGHQMELERADGGWVMRTQNAATRGWFGQSFAVTSVSPSCRTWRLLTRAGQVSTSWPASSWRRLKLPALLCCLLWVSEMDAIQIKDERARLLAMARDMSEKAKRSRERAAAMKLLPMSERNPLKILTLTINANELTREAASFMARRAALLKA